MLRTLGAAHAPKPAFRCGDAVEFLAHRKAKSRTSAVVQRMLDPTRVLVRYGKAHSRIVAVAALRRPKAAPARSAARS